MTEIRNLFNHGIDTLVIRVSNIVSARKWYQEVMGLTPVWNDPDNNLIVLETGGMTSLTLWQTDDSIQSNKATSSYPIFKTTEIELARQHLQEKGVKVGDLIDETLLKYFFFYDEDGNMLEACQVEQ